LGVFLLLLTETFDFETLFFEATSAMGNVGLSVGITPSLSVLGKLIVSALMMIGRIGPLSIGIVIFKPNQEVVQEEDIAL
jgi:trk system potassium uptake protein TrkH